MHPAKLKGDALMDDGKPAEALVQYNAAYAETQDPAILYNRGRALEAMAEYPAALNELEKFQNVAPEKLRSRVESGLKALIGELRAKTSLLHVECDVAGVQIRLRDRSVGQTPLAEWRVNAGEAVVDAAKEGYQPLRIAVTLPPGGSLRLPLTLVPVSTAGVLLVRSRTSGAFATVDQSHRGSLPLELPLTEGRHAVLVEHPGYEPFSSSVVLARGERKTLNVELTERFALTKQWWFWTGLGVLVVGAGVGTYLALTTEKDAGRGDFGPGRTSLPIAGGGFR
jgi:hypothetical protein